jgi:hypothetical protein
LAAGYFLLTTLSQLLDAILGSLALSKPSFLYLAIAVATAGNAVFLTHALRSDKAVARLWIADNRAVKVNQVILWFGFLYLALRFPITAFAVPPVALGHGLLAFVMYSLLFAPLWIGLVVLAWKLTRRASAPAQPQRRRAVTVLAALCGWGLLGEMRLLLDPELIERLGRL